MSEKAKKRFIAGASCPQCQAQDSLRVWMQHDATTDEHQEVVECVECDYSQVKTEQPETGLSQQKSHKEQKPYSDQEIIGVFTPD